MSNYFYTAHYTDRALSSSVSDPVGLTDSASFVSLTGAIRDYTDIASLLRDGGGNNILGIESSFETDSDLDGIADGWLNQSVGTVSTGINAVDSGALVSVISGGHGSFSQSLTVSATSDRPRGILGPLLPLFIGAQVTDYFRVRNPTGSTIRTRNGFVVYGADGVTPYTRVDVYADLVSGATINYAGMSYKAFTSNSAYVRPYCGFDATATGTLVFDTAWFHETYLVTPPAYTYFDPANRIELITGAFSNTSESVGLSDSFTYVALTGFIKEYVDVASMLRDGGGNNILGIESSFETDADADGIADGWRLPTASESIAPDAQALVATMSGGHGSFAQSITRSGAAGPVGLVTTAMYTVRPGQAVVYSAKIRNPGVSSVSYSFGVEFYRSQGSWVSGASSGGSITAGATQTPSASTTVPFNAYFAVVIVETATAGGTLHYDNVYFNDGKVTPSYDYVDPANRIQLTSGGATLTRDVQDSAGLADSVSLSISKSFTDRALGYFPVDVVSTPLVGHFFSESWVGPGWEGDGDVTWVADSYHLVTTTGGNTYSDLYWNFPAYLDAPVGTRLYSKVGYAAPLSGVNQSSYVNLYSPYWSVQFRVENGRLLRDAQGTAPEDIAAHDISAHAFLAFRLEADAVYYETSSDGKTWTAQGSLIPTNYLTTPSIVFFEWIIDSDVDNTMYVYSFNALPLSVTDSAGLTDSFSTPAAPTGGRPAVWTGSAWVAKPAKIWTGSAWVEKPMKRWTGSEWELV